MASTTFRQGHKESSEHWDKAKEAGKEAMDKAKQAGAEAVENAKEAGAGVLGKVKEAGSDALGAAKETMLAVGDMASETAVAAGKKADDMTAAAGHGIASFGEKIGENAPHEGLAGRASQAVASTIKEGGRYIEEHKLSGMAHDVEQVVKNHPIPAILLALGLGFCIGRAMRD